MDADQQRVAERRFRDFLESDHERYGAYRKQVQKLLASGGTRLMIDIDHLRDWTEPELLQNLLTNPSDHLPPLEAALHSLIDDLDPTFFPKHPKTKIFIGFEGNFGRQATTARGLRAPFLNHLVSVDGIVTKLSNILPKIVKSVHYCPTTKQTTEREYRDATANDIPTPSVYPTQDNDGNALVTQYGLSEYKNFQTCAIQEMPERAPPGELPRSIDCILEHDLVDQVKPGDRVRICGVYKALGGRGSGHSNAVFRTILMVNNVTLLNKEINQPNLTERDIANIHSLAEDPDVLDVLTDSVAPAIYGNETAKKALLLQLLGGVEKNLPTGLHLRGDINVMLIGDPSTAKSQLLRFAMRVAPLAISTTGRGSTGVGLTAAVTYDRDSGERRLEAGAMVLADRGLVCIDEFDKMSDADRTAMHEVMEQQTVTIAKAGVHTSLNARCSVLAAANPVYGQYRQERTPMDNIGLPDSLLSRFDLLFIFLDQVDRTRDQLISEHVLRMHSYRGPQEMDMFQQRDEEAQLDEEEGAMYEPHSNLFRAPASNPSRRQPEDASRRTLSVNFIRKYIYYAKNNFNPVLSAGAVEVLSEAYTKLRTSAVQTGFEKNLPITARTLETLVRLATAHAKIRLSDEITSEDAARAALVLEQALFSRRVSRPKRRAESDNGGSGGPGGAGDGDSDADGDGDGDGGADNTSRSKRVKHRAATDSASASSDEEDETDGMDLGDERFAEFKAFVVNAMREDDMPQGRFYEQARSQGFTTSEIDIGVAKLVAGNFLMVSDGTVFKLY